MTIALHPLPTALPDLDELPPESTRVLEVDEPSAYPCRRCLEDARPGERVVLLSYDPFTGDSPYRQPGPIFVHERDCAAGGGLVRAGELPDQLARRVLSVRAFGADHLMRSGTVTAGAALEDVAGTLLEDADVAYLHVHNAGPGCFAVRIDRA